MEKTGELERLCTEEAKYALPIMDEDEITPIDGIPLCQEHSDKFDEGRSLMVRTRKGEVYLIQLNPSEQESILDTVQ